MGNRVIDIYVDGACRGNPGIGAAAILLKDSRGHILHQEGRPLGMTTNNQAEYYAILFALREAIRRGIPSIRIHTDSELAARQINGTYRVKDPTLKKLYEEVMQLLHAFHHVRVVHVPREENREADRLANNTIDGMGKR